MKLKNLLFSTLFLGGCSIAFLTLSSNSGGIMGKSTTGCGGGSCHGTAATTSVTSTITLTEGAMPVTTYIPGHLYTVTLYGAYLGAKAKAGFDLTVTGGTISNGATNTMAMGTEIHHTSPFTTTTVASVSAMTTTFSWTAPTAATATFNVAMNLVDGTGSVANDVWNTSSVTFNQAPASVNNIDVAQVEVYPNPANSFVIAKTNNTVKAVKAVDMAGNVITLACTKHSSGIEINTSNLATGNYVLVLETNEGRLSNFITKQ